MKYYVKKYQEPYQPLNKNYPDEVMEHWWQGNDKKFREAVKNYDNYYGKILPEVEITATKTTKPTTSDWASEHDVQADNKQYEKHHQKESTKVASTVSKKMNEIGKQIGLNALEIGSSFTPLWMIAPATRIGLDISKGDYANAALNTVLSFAAPYALGKYVIPGAIKGAQYLDDIAIKSITPYRSYRIAREFNKAINDTKLLIQEPTLKLYNKEVLKQLDGYQLGYKTSGIGTKRVKLNSKHWVRDITNKEKPQMLGVRPDTKTIKYQKEVDHYDIKNPEFINIQNKILSLENYIPKETWILNNKPGFNFKGVSFDNTLHPPKIYNVEKASRLVNQFGTYVSKNPNRYIVREKISEIPITLYHKKGGTIHIKEKNKGKFTEAAKRAGKSVQEHARDVVNNPKATKLQKKRAQFALNSKKFKHD